MRSTTFANCLKKQINLFSLAGTDVGTDEKPSNLTKSETEGSQTKKRKRPQSTGHVVTAIIDHRLSVNNSMQYRCVFQSDDVKPQFIEEIHIPAHILEDYKLRNGL